MIPSRSSSLPAANVNPALLKKKKKSKKLSSEGGPF